VTPLGPAWSTRLTAGFIVAVLIAVGAGFLLASAYMALSQALSRPIAALILGASLIVVALLALWITSWVSARATASLPERRYAPGARLTRAEMAEAEALAAQAGAPELGEQLGLVLRNLSPVTIGALVLGAVVGMLRQRSP
jgi:type VI protein secretion system component VasK